jgi:hypothetical protein
MCSCAGSQARAAAQGEAKGRACELMYYHCCAPAGCSARAQTAAQIRRRGRVTILRLQRHWQRQHQKRRCNLWPSRGTGASLRTSAQRRKTTAKKLVRWWLPQIRILPLTSPVLSKNLVSAIIMMMKLPALTVRSHILAETAFIDTGDCEYLHRTKQKDSRLIRTGRIVCRSLTRTRCQWAKSAPRPW